MAFGNGIARVRAWVSALALIVAALSASSASAALPASVQNGVNWLNAQVRNDGTLAGESASIATPLQAREETFVTLGLLATAPSSLNAAIAANTDSNLAYRTRRMLAAGANGETADADVAALLAQQNADGGWGVAPGYQSNALDTAFALQALAAVHASAATAVANALGYLAQARLADNGYGMQLSSTVFISANVLLGANAWSTQFPTGTTVAGYARDWLLAQRNGTQTFGSVLTNAVALRALATQTAQSTVLQPLTDALNAAQRSDGSWADDPYQTALALNALWFASQPGSTSTTGGVQGKVVDQTNGSAIAGATVLIVGNAAATSTATDGTFGLSAIAPGGYSLQVSAAGYSNNTVSVQIIAGQTLNLGSIALSPHVLTASVSGVVRDTNGNPLSGVQITVGTSAIVTDAQGRYQITGLAPGTVSLAASANGYQTVNATLGLAAGASYVFSPTMYPTYAPPPSTASITGVVVDGASQNPIAGASVALNGTTQATDASGKFSFTAVAIGTFSLNVSAGGYQSVVASGTVAPGPNNVGTITLQTAPKISSLSGHVTDADTHAPIAGTVLTVQGQALTATTDATGAYVINGIVGTSINLSVSASGYASQVLSVTLPQIGNSVLDFTLTKPVASGIRFRQLQMGESSVAPHDDAELNAQLSNASGNAATLTVQAVVTDAQGNVQFVFMGNKGLGAPPINLPVIVPANGTLDLPMRQALLRQAAGSYNVHAQAFDSNGVVVAEADTQFTVTVESLLAGGVVPNPPLAQVGTNQPIALSADLTNVGNVDITAGMLDVNVVLSQPDNQTSTLPKGATKQLADGTPLNSSRGLVADSAGNFYTINYNDTKLLKIDSSGTVSVAFTLPQLLYPIGLARDAQGNFWIPTVSGVYELTPQGVLSSPITIASLSYIYGFDLAPNGDLLVSGIASTGWRLVRRTPQGQESILWDNGLSAPESIVQDGAGGYVVTNSGDYTLVHVSNTGSITPFAKGFNHPVGIARDTQGNYYVANNGDGTIAKVSPSGQVSSFAHGLNQPEDLKFDASGNLFVSTAGDNAISRILPDGTVQLFARGLATYPEGMKYDAAGTLWIANDDGTVRTKDAAGNVAVVASGLSSPRGLALDASGNAFVANSGAGAVSKISGTGVSTFATGLSNPYGVAIDNSGNVYVAERGANRIRAYTSTGTPLPSIVSAIYAPTEVHVGSAGETYVLNSDHITVIAAGVPSTLIGGFSASYIAPDPVHGGVVALKGGDVYHVAADGTQSHLNSSVLPFSAYGIGVDAQGDVLLLDTYNKRIQKLDATGTLSVYATLPSSAQKMTTDLSGRAYVRYDDGYTLAAVSSSGTVTQIPLSLGQYISTISTSQDGHVLVWANDWNLYSVDSISGAATRLVVNSGNTNGMTQDATGTVYVADYSADELRSYNGSGALQSTLSGYSSPLDIVWTGSEFRFVDSAYRFFALTPGGYPRRLGTFPTNYLAVSGGEIYGTAGSIVHWNGSSSEIWTSRSDASFNAGIATRGDGALTAADNSASRVMTFDASKSVLSDFAGLIQPGGLVFDAQGRLYVANYGSSSIVRFDAGSTVPTVFTKGVSNPRYVAFDGNGNLWVTGTSDVRRFDANGVVTVVTKSASYNGMLISGNTILAVDRADSELLSYDGQNWNALASGLSRPVGLYAAPTGDIYVANQANGVVSRYSNGALSVAASGIASVSVVHGLADGSVYAGNSGGYLYEIEPDGTKVDLHVTGSVNYLSWYGIAPGSDANTSYGLVSGYNYTAGRYDDEVVSITRTQTPTPPPAGTVVYHTSVPMTAMPAIDGYSHFDLGTWLPPYGGDFRVDVSRAGVDGGASNFVHVGPAADGALTALEPELPPGDQTESMCLSLTGADFTSISRVETGEIHPVVSSNDQPNGLATDKAGNVYYTTGIGTSSSRTSALYKSDLSGQITQLAGGLNFSFGLASDSKQNLYGASLNATTGHYDLLKFDLTGVATKVADLGVSRTNGVAVDSHDNVLVGSPGALLKVNAQGVVSVVTQQGLPNPRGIAIDGYDNVYVQNESGYISLIRPDGTVTDVYSTGNGIDDPSFEGDGFPNIAADCSDNFYIAPHIWAKFGPILQTYQEEHVLVQVIPRTGQTSLSFDTLTVNPRLGDIDYLSFDRFGNRILMWNHDDRKVWQVPVTCGAIGVNAHVVTKPGQTISGATVPTSSVLARTDGGKEYVWSLQDVTASGQQVCFDTLLKGLTLGETRPTLASSYLTFQNSFAPNDVQEQLNVPAVHVANVVNLNVATDQAEYPAQATAQVTTTLSNANPTIVEGTLVVNVYDATGAFVGGVTRQSVSVPALGSLPVTAPFAIGAIVPAQYTVTALLSNNGLDLARGQTTFDVLPNNATSSATSFVHTDKQTYNPNDSVVIASRAQSLSSNIVLTNLTLMVTVADASGTQQFTHGFPIAQLLPGATLDFSTTQTLANAAPGIYTVKQDLTDDAGHVLSHVEAAYNVASTSDTGYGLTGSIAVTPKSLDAGQPLSLNATAINHGNGALSNLPLTISIVDPATGAVLQSFTQTSNIAVGASVPFAATWTTQGSAGTYFAVLSAAVGSGSSAKTLTLGVDTFALTVPAFHLAANVSLSATPPPLAALVLVDATVPSAELSRLNAALTSIGYVGTFVNTATDFGNSVRTGAYQAYLLLASGVAPDATTLRLLREGVHRGEGLIVANGIAQLPDALAQTTGLNASSGLSAVNALSIDTLASAPGGAAHEAFSPTLASRFIVPQAAQTLATQATRLPATPDAGTLSDELALRGRIDVGYFGSDAGTGNTQLALSSLGRLQNGSGAATGTVWRIRNSGTTARSVTLASNDGTYSLPFTIAAQTDTFIASLDVAGTATHRLVEGNQTIDTQAAIATVFSDTRLIDVGDNPGAIALWANASNVHDALDWSGAQHTLHGAVHSNSDIVLSGSQNLVDGPLNYATTFSNSGSQNTFTYLPRQVAPQPMPTPLNLDDFKPGGAVSKAVGTQYFDQTAECASKHVWQRSGNKVSLAAGVYWIPCDVHIAGNSPSGTVSLVSTGAIQIDGARPVFQPFYQGVQFATSMTGAGAIKLTGSSLQVGGVVFAPSGTVEASGSAMNFACSVIADQIRLAGAKTTIDVRQCAYATEQRQLPAVVWNAFGTGMAAYAAFDWQGAIGTYESAQPGVLAKLFGGVLAHVAPGSSALRAGTVVPLGAKVQSTADPFQGQLAIAANDDSTFVPAATPWALDFSKQSTFQAQTNVRLGSGATTGLTATVSAATPLVINPLATGTLSLAHLPGESIATLLTAATAIASPDAALTNAIAALQAAQASQTANDRAGVISHLLDAAEACGQSSNTQADALRTRIDWVLWATTH